MNNETRIDIVDHGVRWANNILTEVQHNHGIALGPNKKAALKEIVQALGNYLDPGIDRNET